MSFNDARRLQRRQMYGHRLAIAILPPLLHRKLVSPQPSPAPLRSLSLSLSFSPTLTALESGPNLMIPPAGPLWLQTFRASTCLVVCFVANSKEVNNNSKVGGLEHAAGAHYVLQSLRESKWISSDGPAKWI